MDYSVATAADTDAITETITLAFLNDPIWGPALRRADGNTDHLRPLWRIFVEGSLRFDGAYLTPGATAVATWAPPGESEVTDEQEAAIIQLLTETLDADRVGPMMELFERFDAAHPHDVPHAYLGFLATHPDHRGHGIAQQLLAENLKDLDARGIPAYLESSNPVNDHRYERLGFRSIGRFSAVLDESTIGMMWRDPR